MLYRSSGAPSFAAFWQHWNPVFGYLLGTYVFAPLKRVTSPSVALIVTFIVTGIIHDLVTMAVRQDIAFLFTPWFLFLGIGVVLSKVIGMDISARPWGLKAATHLLYLGACLGLAFVVFTIR